MSPFASNTKPTIGSLSCRGIETRTSPDGDKGNISINPYFPTFDLPETFQCIVGHERDDDVHPLSTEGEPEGAGDKIVVPSRLSSDSLGRPLRIDLRRRTLPSSRSASPILPWPGP